MTLVQCTVPILKVHPVRHAQFSVTQKEGHDYEMKQHKISWDEWSSGEKSSDTGSREGHLCQDEV